MPRDHVHLPGGLTAAVLVGGVAAPQALDQRGRRYASADHVFLPLLLLHLERETGAEDAGGQREKWDAGQGAEGGHDLALPGDGDGVAVADCAEGDYAPPEGVGEALEFWILIFFDHVDDKGGEDENKESDVECRD